MISLSAAEAVELALREDPGISNDQSQLALRRAEQDAVWNRFLPSMQLSLGPSYSLGEEVQDRWRASGSLSARLALSGNTRIESDRRDAAAVEARLALEETRWALRREVLLAYYELVSRSVSVALQEQRTEAARRRLQQTERNFESGIQSEFELLQARLSYQNTLPDLSSAKGQLRAAQRNLRALIGLEPGTPVEVTETVPSLAISLDADSLLRRYADRAPAVRRAELSRAAAAIEAEAGEKSLLPTLSAAASVGYGGSQPFRLDDETWRRTGSLSLSLSLPLDPFVPASEAGLRRRSQAVAVEAASNRLTDVVTNLERDLRNAVDAAVDSARRIEVLKSNAELAERVYQIAVDRFEAGAIDALELENSEIERTRAQVTAANERLALIQRLIEIEHLLGIEFEQTPW